jgi:MinD superfamily P-loop ATPase
MEICNACRYCEGFCAVFPAVELRREFSAGDLSYLANLCHGCRGCYFRHYASNTIRVIGTPNWLTSSPTCRNPSI